MQALVFERKEAKYVLAKVASKVSAGSAISLGPLQFKNFELDDTISNKPEWVKLAPRLSGICGSDLSTLSGNSSRYFEPMLSFPFVMGHEIVADIADTKPKTSSKKRVVVDAVLRHQARGFGAPHQHNDYGYLVSGELPPGMQIGLCGPLGGGWGEELFAHTSQLHSVPEDFSDKEAVLVEPVASGIHAALVGKILDRDLVVVIGAGTIGLAIVAAVRKYTSADKILVAAKYPHQQKLAKELGADEAVVEEHLIKLLRKMLGCQMIGGHLSSGADVVIDAVGSSASIQTALKLVCPRGRLVVCGMPASVNLDLAPLWHQEIEMCGAYAYGLEEQENLDAPTHTFDLAFDLIREAKLERLVSATYPLTEYKEALQNAFEAGKRGDSKIAFDLRTDS